MTDDLIQTPKWRPRRRHSIATNIGQTGEFKALGASSGPALVPEGPPGGPGRQRRRQSIQESLQSITKSMSSTLQKAMNLGGSTASLHSEKRSRLNKTFFRELLSSHFKQPDLKVTKFSLRPVPNPHTNQILHEAEVWIKDGRGRRKLDLFVKHSGRSRAASDLSPLTDGGGGGPGSPPELLSPAAGAPANGWVLDGTNDEMERESKAYSEVIRDMWLYLKEDKGIDDPDEYLCLPSRYSRSSSSPTVPSPAPVLPDVLESHEENSATNNPDDILVLQDLFRAGYHSAPQDRMDESGLDFNHSIMAISRLARFHAVSFAMRNERDLDMVSTYPFLAEDPVYRPDTKDLFLKSQNNIHTRLTNIFQQDNELKSNSSFFLDAVRRLHALQCDFVKDSPGFGVLCHGDLWRQNVLYFYGSSLECQTDCLDVKFEDLHRVRFASCVTDILYFLFTTVDYEVRKEHMLDFLGVYHDHFKRTVFKLCPEVSVFSREHLFAEFSSHILYGFLEGICLFSTVYESQLRKLEGEERQHPEHSEGQQGEFSNMRPRYADYKEAVLAMIRDVVRFKEKERAQ